MTDYEDSPFTSIFSIQDKSMPINDSFIKKDEVRFDEPKVKKTKDNIPYGSMDLGVDPNKTFKVNQGETVLPKENNTEVPDDDLTIKPKRKSVLAFKTPTDDAPEYVDPRLPKPKKGTIKLSPRQRDEL